MKVQEEVMEDESSAGGLPAWVYHVEIFLSAVFFALSTLLAKWILQRSITTGTITFFRFSIGLALIVIYMAAMNVRLEIRNPVILILRGLSNLLAVYLSYWAIKYTTITNANLLNLTYPVFVALMSPIFLKEHLKRKDWIMLFIAGIGIVLIVNPNFAHANIGDIIGLGSGLAAGLAIIMLCFARKNNHTATILLFLLGTGTLCTWPAIIHEDIRGYSAEMWWLLIGCGMTGVLGTARVIIAAILGFTFLGEIPTWNVVFGSVILFAGIYLLAAEGKKAQSPQDSNQQ
jgi:drug/metabolite transporter (DMT)-like permease